MVTYSYNIFVPYTVRNFYERLVGGPFTVAPSTSNIVGWNMIALVVLGNW